MAKTRIKKVFKKVLNGSTISGAMLEEGYAATTASTTGKITQTKAWQALVQKHLSDEDLVKVHKEGLQATRSVPQISGRDSKGAPEYEYITEPDFFVRHKYLDSGYKIKGRYKEAEDPANKVPTQTIIVINAPAQVAIKQ